MFVNTTSERVGFYSNQNMGPAPYPGVIGRSFVIILCAVARHDNRLNKREGKDRKAGAQKEKKVVSSKK
jgi:hypothetical protein